MTKLNTLRPITLKASANILTDYLRYTFNFILYLRGVENAKLFDKVSRYGLTLYLSNDLFVFSYLECVLDQMLEWFLDNCVRRVYLVIIDYEGSEAVEKWNFDVESEVDGKIESQVSTKSLDKVQREIQDVLRQTSASVSFLNSLPDDCCFEIHVALSPGTPIPPGWKRCKNVTIKNGEEFVMRSFSTGLQKVRTSITIKPTIKI